MIVCLFVSYILTSIVYSYMLPNDAVHLRAAFCAAWCNRLVLRGGLFAFAENELLHRAERASCDQARSTATHFSARPLRSGASRYLEHLHILQQISQPL